jgi:hypothetical protein
LREDGASLREVERSLEERGWTVLTHALRELDVAPCRGCFACWVKTPGVCIIDDMGREIAKAVVQSDLVVYITPVTFGGYSSVLKKAVDRLIPLILPYFRLIDGEVHHVKRYERYPRLLGLGIAERADTESERVFRTVVERNGINMHAPSVHTAFLRGEGEASRRTIDAALSEVLS